MCCGHSSYAQDLNMLWIRKERNCVITRVPTLIIVEIFTKCFRSLRVTVITSHCSNIVLWQLLTVGYSLFTFYRLVFYRCMSVHNCGLTVVLLKRHLIWFVWTSLDDTAPAYLTADASARRRLRSADTVTLQLAGCFQWRQLQPGTLEQSTAYDESHCCSYGERQRHISSASRFVHELLPTFGHLVQTTPLF